MSTWRNGRLPCGRTTATIRRSTRCLDAARLGPGSGLTLAVAEACQQEVAVPLRAGHSAEDIELLLMQGSFEASEAGSQTRHAALSNHATRQRHRQHWRGPVIHHAVPEPCNRVPTASSHEQQHMEPDQQPCHHVLLPVHEQPLHSLHHQPANQAAHQISLEFLEASRHPEAEEAAGAIADSLPGGQERSSWHPQHHHHHPPLQPSDSSSQQTAQLQAASAQQLQPDVYPAPTAKKRTSRVADRRAQRAAQQAQQQQQGQVQSSASLSPQVWPQLHADAASGTEGIAQQWPQPPVGARQSPLPSTQPHPAAVQGHRLEAELTAAITSASCPSHLHHILRNAPCPLNHVHVTAALRQLLHLTRYATPMQQQATPPAGQPAQPGSPAAPLPQQPEPPAPPRPRQPAHDPDVQRLALQLARMALHRVRSMRMREVTCCMSSLIHLRVPLSKADYIILMERAAWLFNKPDTTTQGLAELVWAIARSGMQRLRPDYATKYCAAVAQRWQHMDQRCACRILHGLALLRHKPDPAWAAQLLDIIAHHAPTSNPHDVSSALWSLARLRHKVMPSEATLRTLLHRAGQLWPLFDDRETAIVLWSVARLGQPVDTTWQQAAVQQVCRHIPHMRAAYTLALTCYALGLMGWGLDSQVLVEPLRRLQHARFARLSPQGVALLAYGLARMGHKPHPAWLRALHTHVAGYGGRLPDQVVELLGSAYMAFAFSPQQPISGLGGSGSTASGSASQRVAVPAGVPARQTGAADTQGLHSPRRDAPSSVFVPLQAGVSAGLPISSSAEDKQASSSEESRLGAGFVGVELGSPSSVDGIDIQEQTLHHPAWRAAVPAAVQ